MAEVTVNTNLRNASGGSVDVGESYASTTLGTVPDPSSGRRIPLTDGDGHLHQHQMPEYLLPENLPDGITEEDRQALADEIAENLTPPVTLTLLFENALT